MTRSALVLFAALSLPAAAGEVDDLVLALGADDWSAREEASRALFEIGPSVRPALESARASDDAEVARRAALVLARIEGEIAFAQYYVDLREETAEYLSKLARLRAQGIAIAPVFPRLPDAITGRVESAVDDRLRLETDLDVPPGTPFLVVREGRRIGRATWTDDGSARLVKDWATEPPRPGDTVIDCRVDPSLLADLLESCKEAFESLCACGIHSHIVEIRVPAPLDGKIVAFHPAVRLVMVNLGEKHGVEKGMNFTVHRGDGYVGQVIVEEVFPDMASARVDARFAKKDPAEGDDVTTRIR